MLFPERDIIFTKAVGEKKNSKNVQLISVVFLKRNLSVRFEELLKGIY